MEAIWIILGVVALVAVTAIGIYNRLVALRQNREQSFADVDVYLKNRFALIPNLVKTVAAKSPGPNRRSMIAPPRRSVAPIT